MIMNMFVTYMVNRMGKLHNQMKPPPIVCTYLHLCLAAVFEMRQVDAKS